MDASFGAAASQCLWGSVWDNHEVELGPGAAAAAWAASRLVLHVLLGQPGAAQMLLACAMAHLAVLAMGESLTRLWLPPAKQALLVLLCTSGSRMGVPIGTDRNPCA